MEKSFLVPRDILPVFGNLVKDSNPFHRDISLAKSIGLEDTPVFGTLLQMLTERLIISPYYLDEEGFLYSEHSFRFSNPCYPDKIFNYFIGSPVKIGDTLEQSLNIFSGDKVIMNSKARFFQRRPLSFPFEKKVDDTKYFFSQDYFNSINCVLDSTQIDGKASYLIPSASMISNIVELSKSNLKTDKGLYLSAEFSFYRSLLPEDYFVQTNLVSSKRGFHKFYSVAYQGDFPVVSGNLCVVTK